MKKRLLVLGLVATLAFSAKPAHASGGIGIAVGDPSGITLRFDKLVITAGYSWWRLGLVGAVDYWFMNPKIDASGANLRWYLGAGAFAGFYSTSYYGYSRTYLVDSPFLLGARVPVGLQYFPVNNIELYVEVAPGLQVLPGITFDWQAAAGVRFLIFK